MAADVELSAQMFRRAGEGGVFLPGGNKRGDALLQGLALLYCNTGLPNVSGPLKDVLRNAKKSLAAPGGGEPVHWLGGAGMDSGKGAHGGAGLAGVPENGYVPIGCGQLQRPLHGAAGPWEITALVRCGAAVPGVQAVEHHPEEGRPGGFARFIGSFNDVQTGSQFQAVALQPPEGSGKSVDLHMILLFFNIT